MARVVWKADAFLREVEAQTIRELTAIGREVKAFVRANTPVLTGYARASVYFVVIDGGGRVVAGDSVDDNGVAVPTSFPGRANGQLRCIVGANAPYFIWIDLGTRRRPGKHIMVRALDLMQDRMRQRLRELKVAG